jgi:single-strand DNA-binding protein
MSNVNTVQISGNLTRDPENVGKTTPVVKFGIACNRSYKPKDSDEYVEEVSFFDVTVFGNFGGLVMRKLRKGDLAFVQGRMKQETWEDEDGNKKSRVVVIADQIDGQGMFRSKDEDNPMDGSGASASASASTAAPVEADKPADEPTPDDDIPF